MLRSPFLHDHRGFSDLIRIVADEIPGLTPELAEKDYWIMHCLYGLAALGLKFELKGGTSLSKGFGIVQRFSEDIDIRIDPSCAPFKVYTGANQTKKTTHVQSRQQFYDWLAEEKIRIDGIGAVERDHNFDDEKLRSGGIRLRYDSSLGNPAGLKEGILLEVGFDDTHPNLPRTISSWAYDYASHKRAAIVDNRAIDVPCYHPGYTFVEKLQTVSTKFRHEQASGTMPTNFMRHYYDISQLLENSLVRGFIGTSDYHARKKARFRRGDNPTIADNEAFLLSDPSTRKRYADAYEATAGLYFAGQIPFETLMEHIRANIKKL